MLVRFQVGPTVLGEYNRDLRRYAYVAFTCSSLSLRNCVRTSLLVSKAFFLFRVRAGESPGSSNGDVIKDKPANFCGELLHIQRSGMVHARMCTVISLAQKAVEFLVALQVIPEYFHANNQ